MGVATASAQQAVGNSKVNTDFSKYKSFTWAKSDPTLVGANGYDIYYYEFEPANKLDKVKQSEKVRTNKEVISEEPYVYSYSVIIPAQDENVDAIIKDAITNELEGRGYRGDPATGDLIVAYQVLDKKAQLHGYRNDSPETVSGQQVREPADTTTFALDPGTLIITLIDGKTSEMVWDGFSRNMNKNEVFMTDEVALKKAVHNIFNEFKYSADKARRN
jgi:hypothetical protein